MARLRAVVTIQPPGFGGIPVRGHRSAAIANASATASSARSMLPRTRISVAVQRPTSRRYTWSRTSVIPRWAAPPPAAQRLRLLCLPT